MQRQKELRDQNLTHVEANHNDGGDVTLSHLRESVTWVDNGFTASGSSGKEGQWKN